MRNNHLKVDKKYERNHLFRIAHYNLKDKITLLPVGVTRIYYINSISSGYSHSSVTLSDNYLVIRLHTVRSLVPYWYNLEFVRERKLFNSQYGHHPE